MCATASPRLMTLGSMFGLFSSCALLCFSKTYGALLLARAIHGLASASLQVATMRHIHDTFNAQNVDEPMSKVMSAMASGMLLGPLIGGIASEMLGVSSVFLCGAVGFSLLGGLLSLALDDAPCSSAAPPFLHLLEVDWVCVLSLGIAVVASVISSLQPMLPPHATSIYQVSATWIGGMMSLFMAGYAVASPLASHAFSGMDKLTLSLRGFVGLAVALVLLMLKWGMYTFMVLVALLGFLAGVAVAPAVPLLFEASNAGQATSFWQIYSMFDAAYALGIAVGPFFAGFAANRTIHTMAHEPLVYQLGITDVVVVLYAIALAVARHRLSSLDRGTLGTGEYGAVAGDDIDDTLVVQPHYHQAGAGISAAPGSAHTSTYHEI